MSRHYVDVVENFVVTFINMSVFPIWANKLVNQNLQTLYKNARVLHIEAVTCLNNLSNLRAGFCCKNQLEDF